MRPIAHFILDILGIDVQELNYFEKNEEILTEIEELKNKINELKDDNQNLKNMVSQSHAEKEGFIKGIEEIKIEKINWSNVFKVFTLVIIIGGVTYYYIFSGSDFSIFKPIISHITESINTLINSNGETSKEIIKRIISNEKTIEDLGIKLQTLINMVNNKDE